VSRAFARTIPYKSIVFEVLDLLDCSAPLTLWLHRIGQTRVPGMVAGFFGVCPACMSSDLVCHVPLHG